MITQFSLARIHISIQQLFRPLSVLLILVSLLLGPASSTAAHAHGGVIVDGGFTDDFEWLVSVSPFPIVEGESVITILIYDLNDYSPVNGLDATLLLAPPDSKEECCEEGVHQGPIELEPEPELYPGDYSNFVQFDQLGEWGARFIVKDEKRTIDAVVSLNILPADPFDESSAADETPDRAATETAFAENVNSARQSPLETPVPNQAASPLDSPLLVTDNTITEDTPENPSSEPESSATADDTEFSLFSAQTLVWLSIGLIPILLILLWMVRPKDDLES